MPLELKKCINIYAIICVIKKNAVLLRSNLFIDANSRVDNSGIVAIGDRLPETIYSASVRLLPYRVAGGKVYAAGG